MYGAKNRMMKHPVISPAVVRYAPVWSFPLLMNESESPKKKSARRPINATVYTCCIMSSTESPMKPIEKEKLPVMMYGICEISRSVYVSMNCCDGENFLINGLRVEVRCSILLTSFFHLENVKTLYIQDTTLCKENQIFINKSTLYYLREILLAKIVVQW